MNESNQIAVNALQARLIELLDERMRVRRRLLESTMRDIEIDRDITGCYGGAKALGGQLVTPPGPDLAEAKRQTAQVNFLNARNSMSQTFADLRTPYGLDDRGDDIDEVEIETRQEMPRIADIIIEQLTAAGTDGMRSDDIRKYILDKYEADIHKKTVGMTLYRLQQDNQVHREGRTWLLGAAPPDEQAPQTEDREAI